MQWIMKGGCYVVLRTAVFGGWSDCRGSAFGRGGRGERKYEKETTEHKHHRIKRSYGSFMRSFSLPENTDGSKLSADYKDGMLTVHLPKSEKAKSRAIEVKVA